MRGSTALLTDEKGRVTDRYQYGLFGEVEHIEGATYQPFQYNGRDGVVTDPNGLYDMRTRFYNPVLKRFLQRDIWPGRLEETQSLNRHAYVQGNPVSFIDPLGLSCKNVMPSPEGTGKTVQPNDVVPYRPSSSPLENHHGVLDVWAKHNVPNYVSRGTDTPTIALTNEQHAATKAVYRDWLFEKTGKKVGGTVDWTKVSPQEMQSVSERMFDAAKVPQSARQEYYNAFNQYNYRE